jgi:hypothetical protein
MALWDSAAMQCSRDVLMNVRLRTVVAVSRELCSPMADPKKYRDEAERLREEASESADPEIRGTMLDIAELYHRLAEALERHRREPYTC